MRNITRISLSVLVLLSSGFAAPGRAQRRTPQPPAKTKSSLNIVGNYFEGGGYGGRGITLLENGQYVFRITSDTELTKESGGNYTITDGLLVLSPRYRVNSVIEQSPQAHIVRTREAMSEPEMCYLPVKWGKRLYLLESGKEELRFCNSINLGDEPVPRRSFPIHLFVMRRDDEKKTVTGKPQLPDPWNAYLLSRPVRGKLIRVQKSSPTSTVTVNVGSANGIRVGMEFIDNRRDNTFTVTAVTAHQATLKAYGTTIHTGDIISTRRTRSLWR